MSGLLNIFLFPKALWLNSQVVKSTENVVGNDAINTNLKT